LAWKTTAEDCAEVATQMGLPISADTVLRILMSSPDPQLPTPRVLGVDDWAWRKGHSYCTILLDLETHRVVDLLPDRKPETLQKWLEDHPGVEIISRDRASAYAKGARDGAPKAPQVADRWHLLVNLGKYLERLFTRVRKQLGTNETTLKSEVPDYEAEPPAQNNPPTTPSSSVVTPGQKNRQARFDAIKELRGSGMSFSKIAKTLHLNYRTVLKYAKIDCCPEATPRRPQSSIIDPYVSYIRQKLADGCHNARILFAELEALGYQGSLWTLQRWLARYHKILKSHADIKGASLKALSPRTFKSWFLLPWTRLSCTAIKSLEDVLQMSPEFRVAFTLTHQFHTMVSHRAGHALDAWMKAAIKSGIPELQGFVKSIQKDLPAVYAGLTQKWSQGPVEGNNNRLKLIKREMYGRAKFDLLRKRVIHAP
jgi:transposase